MEKAEALQLNMSQRMKIEETILKEKGRLFNFIRKSVSNIEDAEDILQDVFYQLAAGYNTIQSVDKISSWLFTVARNKITDRFRKKKTEPQNKKKISYDYEDGEILKLEDILPSLSGSPEDDYLKNLIMEEIMDAMEELPGAQRKVFVMNEFDGKTFREIANETGIPFNTLISRKRYAVLYLRERLKDFFKEIL